MVGDKVKVSVSYLSSKNLKEDLRKLNVTNADYIHVDVMDGHFVKNKSLPFKKIKDIMAKLYLII